MKTIQLQAAYKDYLWGGIKLREEYGKVADLERIAESWELSNHEAGESIVLNGPYEAQTFGTYLKAISKEDLGTHCEAFENFPILIKFIDAKSALSIQVHPDDTYALEKEHSYGKTEVWYILSCEENAFLYYGVNQSLTPEELKVHIENNTVTDVLNKVYVKPGDIFFIEAGTIHAIGEGIVICEIQQNSNLTYRVYDYNREDAKGQTRPLHIEQALEVCKLEPEHIMDEIDHILADNESLNDESLSNDEKVSNEIKPLASCKYFTTTLCKVSESYQIEITPKSFKSIIIIEGTGTLKEGEETLAFKKGDSFFIPATATDVCIEGKCQFIVTEV